jgi:predicted DCC family thiol-disulfide oxidoreductase YuxK
MSGWRPQAVTDLPEGLVLFDGICVLCAGWVNFIIPRDPEGLYRFVSIQSELGHTLAARFQIDAEKPQTNVVIRDGKAWFKADSGLRVCRDLPGWRWTQVFHVLPRPLRNVFYDLIAQNRYRLFGKRDTCLVPTPALRKRFVVTASDIRA